jgi:signal peptidase I
MSKNRLSHTVLKEIGFSLLAEGKTIRVRADGLSMFPYVRPGSVIFIEPLKEGNLPSPGEIIAWKKETGFVVHRLLRLHKEGMTEYLVTRGDSSPCEDDPVAVTRLAGRVVKIEYPAGKTVPPGRYSNKNPNYKLNRFIVWMILQFSRVKRIF